MPRLSAQKKFIRPELILNLVLCLDLGGHEFGEGQREYLWLHGEQQDDPIVAEGSVLDLPLLQLTIPLVSATHCSRDLFMGQWSTHLLLTYEAAA